MSEDLMNLVMPQGNTPVAAIKSTELPADLECLYQQWVQANNIPESHDYDMRGFFMGLLMGDPAAHSGVNAADGRIHFSDKWKLPNHPSFSAESKYSQSPNDPKWVKNPAPYVPGTWAQSNPAKPEQGYTNVEIPNTINNNK